MVLSLPNRPVRTRMPGGVGGGRREASPYPNQGQALGAPPLGYINNRTRPEKGVKNLTKPDYLEMLKL